MRSDHNLKGIISNIYEINVGINIKSKIDAVYHNVHYFSESISGIATKQYLRINNNILKAVSSIKYIITIKLNSKESSIRIENHFTNLLRILLKRKTQLKVKSSSIAKLIFINKPNDNIVNVVNSFISNIIYKFNSKKQHIVFNSHLNSMLLFLPIKIKKTSVYVGNKLSTILPINIKSKPSKFLVKNNSIDVYAVKVTRVKDISGKINDYKGKTLNDISRTIVK